MVWVTIQSFGGWFWMMAVVEGSEGFVGSWVINNKFLVCFDDEKKILMKNKTFELKKNTLESLELQNKAVKAPHVR